VVQAATWRPGVCAYRPRRYWSEAEPLAGSERKTLTTAVNWGEVTAIATCILALGLIGGFVAAAFTAQQVREARRSREAQLASEFFRRWNEDALVESRRLVARFKSPEELRDALAAYVAAGAPEAYVLYRELDYFEQLAALETRGALDIELITLLLGRALIERWELWRPAIHEVFGPGTYPLFQGLAAKLAGTLDVQKQRA
jgi:hypothetical protein